jgi:hypothetical protein
MQCWDVRLSSRDGASIEIRSISYQFGANTQARVGTDWDTNWLVIRGDVKTAGGRGVNACRPCLITWEAQKLAAWLRGVVDGSVPPVTDLSDTTTPANAAPTRADRQASAGERRPAAARRPYEEHIRRLTIQNSRLSRG